MKITITSPVKHDGKRHAVGATIDVTNEVAKALIASGAAEAAGRGGSDPKAPAKGASSEKAPAADSTDGSGTVSPPQD